MMTSYVAELGFELTAPGFAVRRATDCAVEPCMQHSYPKYSDPFTP